VFGTTLLPIRLPSPDAGEHDAREARAIRLPAPHREKDDMAAKFEVYPSGSQFRWRLKAANGEIVATGEAYTTKAGVKDGIDAVKRAAASATVDNTTDN